MSRRTVVKPQSLIVALALTCAAEIAYAQKPVTISARPSCPDCTIQRVQVVSFGSEKDMGYVGMPAGIARFDGSWVVSHAAKPSSISVFSDKGEFIRDVGKAGAGPGEFRYTSRIVQQGDSLYVYDAALNRMQVYSRQFKPERTFEVDVPVYRMAMLSNGRFIVEGYPRTRDRAGYPLHLVTRDGDVEKSFGAVNPKRDPKAPRAYLRVSTLASDGTVWTGRYTEYVIEQWDVNGKKLAELRGDVPWFPPNHGHPVVSPNDPPKTVMTGIWFDDVGRLWVALSVADPNWKGAVAPATPGMYNAFRVTDENGYRDTILEVIDVRSGSLIARARMDDWLSPSSINGLAITVGEKPDGTQTIDVWRPQLTSTPR